MAKLDFDALNSTIRYLMFSVYAVKPGVLADGDGARAAVVDETEAFLKQQEDNGVVVRGIYDVAGMRADADFMMWTHADTVEALLADLLAHGWTAPGTVAVVERPTSAADIAWPAGWSADKPRRYGDTRLEIGTAD